MRIRFLPRSPPFNNLASSATRLVATACLPHRVQHEFRSDPHGHTLRRAGRSCVRRPSLTTTGCIPPRRIFRTKVCRFRVRLRWRKRAEGSAAACRKIGSRNALGGSRFALDRFEEIKSFMTEPLLGSTVLRNKTEGNSRKRNDRTERCCVSIPQNAATRKLGFFSTGIGPITSRWSSDSKRVNVAG